ncbi:MAG: multidrug effflux MFS transporter [Maritimibacter sp.]|nr:multidrug effflux MFS transporter [Maritimibacter sp.]
MTPSLFRTAAILALMSMVGPFAIDMFLPAMPKIASDLGATEPQVQGTITLYFLAFGVAQLIYGPWADMSGRKPPIYIGLAIFALGSVAAFFAPTIETLVAARFVQGAGGAVMMVVPRAIIRDLYTGHDATRVMSFIMLVISVSPMLAPLAGSGVIALAGWRGVFAVMAAVAGLCLALAAFVQPETLPPERRVPVNLAALAKGAKTLARAPVFLGLTFIGAFGMASFFVFISFAPFVYQGQFGLTPTGFSGLFAINAVGFFGASQVAAPLGIRYGARRVMLAGTAGFAGFATLLLLLALAGAAGLVVIVASLFAANAFLGLVIPTSMVMALEEHGEIAGLASSLGGTLQMLTGGAVVLAAGPFFDGSATPMIAAIAACALIAFALALLTLPRLPQG